MALKATIINPETGTAGGANITIWGTGLSALDAVIFGSTDSTFFTTGNEESTSAQPPAGESGTVDITVVDGAESYVLRDAFTYV